MKRFTSLRPDMARMRGALEDPAGHIPSVDEAKQRLAHLDATGPTQFAFTFRSVHEPDEAFLDRFDWSMFLPCPSAS